MTENIPWTTAGIQPFVVAELGTNHQGSLSVGKEMVRAAARAGASAVKVQIYSTKLFLSPGARSYQLWRKLERGYEFFRELKTEADAHGVAFFATPLDQESVEDCMVLEVPYIKVASCDLTNFPLLEKLAATGKPLILSTGYSELFEVGAAVAFLQSFGCKQITLMHCVAEYPTMFADSHLYMLDILAAEFALPVGLSDHSTGPYASLAAVARGIRLVEKHFTIDTSMQGFDHHMSETEDTLRELIGLLGQTSASLFPRAWERTEGEKNRRGLARRGLYYARQMSIGEVLEEDSIVALRPENGVSPTAVGNLLGKRLRVDVQELSSASLEHFA